MKKNVLITGSTDGIGKLAAIKLALSGHNIYIHGRNKDKLQTVLAEIKLKSKNDNIIGFAADLSEMEAVKQLVEDINGKLSHIDVLINNAGVFKSSKAYSDDGIDMRFAVNYFAPYLLTNKLLPLLEQSSNARVINLSSAAQSEISYDSITGKENAAVNSLYAQSKLALTMWSLFLARQRNHLTVIAVNPGSLLNTNMVNEAFGQYWAPAEKGADVLYDLALADEHKYHSGEYYDNDAGRYSQAHPDTYDNNAVERLIEFTNNIIK